MRGFSNSEPRGVVCRAPAQAPSAWTWSLSWETEDSCKGGRICLSKDLAKLGEHPRHFQCAHNRCKIKCEGSFLFCLSTGLHLAWSLEGFSVSGQFLIVKSSQALQKQHWGLGPAMWQLPGQAPGHLCDTLWKPQKHTGTKARFSKGLGSCSVTRQQNRGNTAEVILY